MMKVGGCWELVWLVIGQLQPRLKTASCFIQQLLRDDQVDNMRFMLWDVRRVASNSSNEKFYFSVQSAVFSCLVWKPLCLLKPDYKRRTYFYLYPPCPSAPGLSPLHQGLICIWMRHSDTEKLHPNSQFCIFNVADICIFTAQPSPPSWGPRN